MGEGFGEYLAASFFADRRPAAVRTLVDEPLTFETFDHSEDADEHENGHIWSATLWNIWRTVGRTVVADRIITESHFQLDGFTRLARGARSILDADRNLYGGRHLRTLSRIFHQREIGPIQ
jgi:hypothetical protein